MAALGFRAMLLSISLCTSVINRKGPLIKKPATLKSPCIEKAKQEQQQQKSPKSAQVHFCFMVASQAATLQYLVPDARRMHAAFKIAIAKQRGISAEATVQLLFSSSSPYFSLFSRANSRFLAPKFPAQVLSIAYAISDPSPLRCSRLLSSRLVRFLVN